MLVGIANGVAVISVAVIGIQWMMATPDKQAKVKERAIGLAISIVVIYGAVGIWTIARKLFETI